MRIWIIAAHNENLVPTQNDSSSAKRTRVPQPERYEIKYPRMFEQGLGTFPTYATSHLQECYRLVRGNLKSTSTLGA